MRSATKLLQDIPVEASQTNPPLAKLQPLQSVNARRSSLEMAVDQELAMVDLWERMGELFGAKWLKQFGDTDSPAFGTWCRYLSDLSADHIKRGFMNLLRDKPQYLPDAVEFRSYCMDLKSLSLSPVRQAYDEACMAPAPKARQKWSHPAVYHAGVATGWHELACMPTEQIFPRFEFHYAEMCRRVVAGESLNLPVVQVIASRVPDICSREENIKRMQALREAIGL